MFSANGVWGGVTPRGDFKLEFGIDSEVTPAEITHEIDKKGNLTPEVGRKPRGKSISRELQGGVLLSLEHAESVANFILTQIAQFREKLKKV